MSIQNENGPAARVVVAPGAPSPTADEVAAALAAIAYHLSEMEQSERTLSVDGWEWHASMLLLGQGLLPRHVPVLPSWGTVERLRRGGRGGSGIIGF